MKPRHVIIGLCMALLLAPSSLAGTETDAAVSHDCSGGIDFFCTHVECTDLMCAWLECPVYIGHSGHTTQIPSCVPP